MKSRCVARRALVAAVRSRSRSASLVVLLLTAVGVAAGPANAQTPPVPTAQPAIEPVATLLPRLMVGAGIGNSTDYERLSKPMLGTASVQYLVGRNFTVEGEVKHWAQMWDESAPGHETRGPEGQIGFSGNYINFGQSRIWSAGVNLLYRSEPRRVSWFAGGGAFLGRIARTSTLRREGCTEPWSRTPDCSWDYSDGQETLPGLSFQGLTGAEVQIAGPLRAYADVRVTPVSGAFLQMSTGVRVVARTRRADTESARRVRRIREAQAVAVSPVTPPPAGHPTTTAAAASGKEVRISLASGARPQGTFVSLTTTEISVRQRNRDVRYPLDQVLLVETVHHTARKAATVGAIAGFLGGWIGTCSVEFESHRCLLEAGALLGAIGVGAGVIVGAWIDRSNAPRHVVYAAPASSRSVHIAPVVTTKKAAVAVAVQW